MSGKEMGDNRSEGKIEIEPTCKIKSEKKGLIEEQRERGSGLIF